MRDSVQTLLDGLKAQNDNRTSVFDLQIEDIQDRTLLLRGKLLDSNQLRILETAFSDQFPDLNLDLSSVQILRREPRKWSHIATNLTGLYDGPTIHLPLSSELCYGTDVEILDEHETWAFTQQKDGYLGWVFKGHLKVDSPPQATHLILAPCCEVRAEPGSDSKLITRLVSGTRVKVEEVRAEWARVEANKTGWIPASLLRALDQVPRSQGERRKTLIEDSARMIGVPYVWGGTSGNGIDCSGLVRLLHKWIGIELPRDADMQYEAARPIELPFEAGDLLFFHEPGKKRKVTHVGMSLGGWRMIHSSQANNGVYIDNLEERAALKAMFVSAGSFVREEIL
jgi:cell wall-associated NlpC family hydrolase